MFSIQINNLSKKYRNNIIYDNTSLQLFSGNLYILKSQNGTGKTTFLKCLCQTIKYGGEIINNKSISYLPEKVILPQYLKAIDFLTLISKVKKGKYSSNNEIIGYYLKRYNIEKYQNKYINTLSLGTKQKILIIQTLLDNKDIYLLDEPINGLDNDSVEKFEEDIALLVSQNKLVILISHCTINFNQLRPKTLLIGNGKIYVESS